MVLKTNTVSMLLQPCDSIFQNRFLDEALLKFGWSSNLWLKNGVLTRDILKFAVGRVLFESGVQIMSIQYILSSGGGSSLRLGAQYIK